MALAADAGRPGGEPRAWARVQLGLLRLGGGDHPGAERELRRALAERPGDPRAEAGLARVLAARGRLAAADRLLARALARQPLPEHAALRAEVAAARGRPAEAREHLALVHAMGRLMRANGVRTDLDLALIEADVRRPDAAAVARARLAWRERPGVVGDGVLGWVLTRAGRCREGLVLARRSLRLGTDDPLMRFHAGMAAACAGERDEARRQLSRALALNPRFSLRWAPAARASLREVSR
ncbi:MAG: tetratricopeptide repeat protein [Thermoleophilia bacterium]|nr:tetratricopeptide repeat protein [Thermoleophilia bacterium]